MDYRDVHKEFAIRDIVALCFNKLVLIVICGLIGGCLFFGFQYINEHTEKRVKEFETAISNYQDNVVLLNNKLTSLQADKENYATNANAIFGLLQDEVYKTEIAFSIIPEKITTNNASLEKYYDQIESQVMVFWNSIDFSAVLGSEYTESFRNVFELKISNLSGSIMVFADSIEKSESIAKTLYGAIKEYISTSRPELEWAQEKVMSSRFYGDKISDLANLILEKQQKIDNEIVVVQKEIKATKAPSHHYLKYGVFGFIAGVGVSILLLIFIVMENNPLISSLDAERRLGIPFLGSLDTENKIWNKISRSILGETGAGKEEGLLFVEKRLKDLLAQEENAKKIAIITSCVDKKAPVVFDTISKTINGCGLGSCLIENGIRNPNLFEEISDCNVILLLEKRWKSRWLNVVTSTKLAEQTGKQVKGFFLF